MIPFTPGPSCCGGSLPTSQTRKLRPGGDLGLGGSNIPELDIPPGERGMDDSLPGPGLAQELAKLTRLDHNSQGRAGLDWQVWSVQGPGLGAWSEEQPEAHPKEFNSSSTGLLAALQA